MCESFRVNVGAENVFLILFLFSAVCVLQFLFFISCISLVYVWFEETVASNIPSYVYSGLFQIDGRLPSHTF